MTPLQQPFFHLPHDLKDGRHVERWLWRKEGGDMVNECTDSCSLDLWGRPNLLQEFHPLRRSLVGQCGTFAKP